MDDFKDESVKDRLSKEYERRVKKVIRSKLNGRNMVRVINSWAVSLLRYSGGVVRWTKVELMNLDRKTRKLLIIQDAIHARANGSPIPHAISRKEGRRGLISLDDHVTLEELSLVDYLSQNCEERLLKAAWRGRNRSELEHPDDYKLEKKARRKSEGLVKEPHGQYI